MSKSINKNKVEAQANRNSKTSQAEVSQVSEQIDTTLKQLRERTIPPQPYLLSVPSDDPYRFSSRFYNTWYTGTPFSAEEEQLQYLSFISHQGEEDSLLKVVGGWADEDGNLIEDELTSPVSLSGQSTPVQQPSRKKISLKDYKTKDKTRPNTPTTKVPAEDLRKQVMKAEAKEYVAKAEEGIRLAKTSEKTKAKSEIRDSPKVQKSQVDGSRSPRASVSRPRDLPSPKKRRRLSDDSSQREQTPVKLEKNRDVEESKHLPLLLSPTLPARQKERSRKGLPGLLSPNLPPGLERLIAKADTKSKLDDGVASGSGTRTEPAKTILGNALGLTASKRPPEKTANDSDVNRIRSDSQTSVSTKPILGTPKVQSPAIKASLKTITRPVTPLEHGVTASPKPRQRHIVVLKYGKKNRRRVEALRKLPARPKKLRPAAEEPPTKAQEIRPTAIKALPEPEKPDRKRRADSSPERPVKKVKQLETPEKPKASGLAAPKSPAVVPGQKPKPELSTPKKELKAPVMRRIESQDGGEVRTPLGDRGRLSTPINTTSSSQVQVSPGPSNAMTKEERAGWQEINSKCFTLGRTLKHEATSLGPSPGNERSEKDQALSVILLIEALLCFMINHAAQSQARPSIDPGWSTILPYHIFVFRASRKYRHLHGLVIQLGAVCRQAIHNHDIERLARDPLPFENCDAAPTPGSDGNTRQNDDIEKLKRKYISFRDQLVHNARELQSAWMEGSRYLPPTLIEREYPKTWAKRTKDTSKRGLEKLKADAIGREYYLPLDINSNAFEATRFSMSFLKEWSEREKVEWKPRVEL